MNAGAPAPVEETLTTAEDACGPGPAAAREHRAQGRARGPGRGEAGRTQAGARDPEPGGRVRQRPHGQASGRRRRSSQRRGCGGRPRRRPVTHAARQEHVAPCMYCSKESFSQSVSHSASRLKGKSSLRLSVCLPCGFYGIRESHPRDGTRQGEERRGEDARVQTQRYQKLRGPRGVGVGASFS